MKDVGRRQVVSLMGGAAAATLAGPAFAQAEPPKPAQLVVNHSGGSMGTAMRKAFFNGFEKKYGIRVVETSPVDFGKLRAMVDSGNVEWDLTEIGVQDVIRAGKANLLEKVDVRDLTAMGFLAGNGATRAGLSWNGNMPFGTNINGVTAYSR